MIYEMSLEPLSEQQHLKTKKLSKDESTVMDALLAPYGVELNTTELLRRLGKVFNSDLLNHVLEALETSCHIKKREVILEGYLCPRLVYSINHVQLHKDAKLRSDTRVWLGTIPKRKYHRTT